MILGSSVHTKRTIPIQSPCEWVVVSKEHAMGTYTTFQPTTWPRHSVSSHSSYSCLQSSIPVYYMGSRAQWTRILLCNMLVTDCFVAQVSQHILHCTYACIDGQITHVGILEYCVLSKMWVDIKCIMKSLACMVYSFTLPHTQSAHTHNVHTYMYTNICTL